MVFKKYKKYFFVVLSVIWIGCIFSFSLQDAEESSAVSNKVGEVIIECSPPPVAEKYESLSIQEKDVFQAVLRKCGHFTEFFVLGVLMYLTFDQTKRVHKISMALLLCMLVGAMDETLQLFVDGRAGQLSDVMIDSCGGLLGICVIYVIIDKLDKIKS